MHHANFRTLKDHTLAEPVRRRTSGGRTQMKVAGNPDVFKEAEGEEDYAKGDERKKGGRAKDKKAGGTVHRMAGDPVKARLDRPSRRKRFADGGAADDDAGSEQTPSYLKTEQAAKRENDATPVADFLRGTRAGYVADAVNRFNRAMDQIGGSGAAYRAGGRAKKFADGGAATDDAQAKNMQRPIDDYDGSPELKAAHAGYAAGVADSISRFAKEFMPGIKPAYSAGGRARTGGK
jgi:hypothetical protein